MLKLDRKQQTSVKQLSFNKRNKREKETEVVLMGKEEIKLCLQKTVWWFLIKVNILLPCSSSNTFFRIYPKEFKTYIHTKTCTEMFIVVSFIMSKLGSSQDALH